MLIDIDEEQHESENEDSKTEDDQVQKKENVSNEIEEALQGHSLPLTPNSQVCSAHVDDKTRNKELIEHSVA